MGITSLKMQKKLLVLIKVFQQNVFMSILVKTKEGGKRINEKNYFIDWDFCSRVIVGSVIESIYYKGATACMSGLYPHTPGGKYLKNFGFKW
mgnify:CR=1 FL=1